MNYNEAVLNVECSTRSEKRVDYETLYKGERLCAKLN